ncbi:diaminopimelate epimerase [Luteipulveratus mongoliensis]|uniref:Diaminopimelate epimerase n=1 Tax=Luteipulveratus mongoliensis TaxID=571913 RepID=A0A0K1JKN4_9MICO|nr:diaminopimelate epimerase [Luteipulveratus mongoliensis]AKU17279.1 diaminopimelate epimerase [Luteipulveratus mongoliensis]
MTTIDFAKGHGTHNDFVLVPDLDGALDLTEQQVAHLCNRRGGIGGDGLIRIVRTGKVADAPEGIDPDLWFMDYRNADGSAAEMCGNGTRVFAEYLRTRGLVTDDIFEIGTRAGTKRISTVPDGYAVDLGTWQLAREEDAERRGMDSVVQVVGAPSALPALSIDLGNPHTVVALPTEVSLDQLDLTDAPHVDPRPPHGTNVELVRPIGHGHIAMRVHERGVGETQSCGTGAAAAAIATWWWGNRPQDQLDWTVDVPGGRLGVHLDGQRVALSGPAVIVAEGRVELPIA